MDWQKIAGQFGDHKKPSSKPRLTEDKTRRVRTSCEKRNENWTRRTRKSRIGDRGSEEKAKKSNLVKRERDKSVKKKKKREGFTAGKVFRTKQEWLQGWLEKHSQHQKREDR